MEREFNSLVETFKKFNGINVLETILDPPWIHFKSNSEEVLALISSQVVELKEQYGCSISIFNDLNSLENFSYQLLFEGNADIKTAIIVLDKKLTTVVESSLHKAKMKEFGIPDLSLVTIRQMAIELKQRKNLTFALVWIENNDRDNIAIEGNGSPTQLVGLLSRGTHMAIEWADKNIKFYHPKDE